MKSEEVFYTLAYMEGSFLVQVFVSYAFFHSKIQWGNKLTSSAGDIKHFPPSTTLILFCISQEKMLRGQSFFCIIKSRTD